MSGWNTDRWARLACRYPGLAWAPTGSAIRGGAARHGLFPSTKASRSSARPSRPGSTSSTRPTGTPPDIAKRSWAARSASSPGVTTSSSRQKCGRESGRGPMAQACRARPFSPRSTIPWPGWGAITSTCIRFIAGIRPRRSKRPWRRCTTSCAAARSATSGHHRWPRGNSRRLSTRPSCTAGPPSCRCKTISTCCTGRRSGRCSRSASTKASASFPGARSRAAS